MAAESTCPSMGIDVGLLKAACRLFPRVSANPIDEDWSPRRTSDVCCPLHLHVTRYFRIGDRKYATVREGTSRLLLIQPREQPAPRACDSGEHTLRVASQNRFRRARMFDFHRVWLQGCGAEPMARSTPFWTRRLLLRFSSACSVMSQTTETEAIVTQFKEP